MRAAQASYRPATRTRKSKSSQEDGFDSSDSFASSSNDSVEINFDSPYIALNFAADELDPTREAKATSRAREFKYDPVGWSRTFIDWGTRSLTPYQDEMLARLIPYKKAEGATKELLDKLGIRSNKSRFAVRGPHGLGKTTLAAIAVLWFSTTRDGVDDWKVVTTASVWRQLERYLWPEIHKWAKKIDWESLGREPFTARELLVLQLTLTTGSAFAAASDDPANIEGAHADQLFYIFDEAKVIPDGSWDAIEGAFSGAGEDTEAEAFALAISTPGKPSGRFYDIHKRRPGLEDWDTRHVTLEEAVLVGRVSKEWADQRIKQYGGPKTVLSQNRVFGNFAQDAMEGVIPLEWVEEAMARWTPEYPTYQSEDSIKQVKLTRVSVDVARFGGDKTVIACRYGKWIDELIEIYQFDTVEVTSTTRQILIRHGRRPECVVDVIGIGAGVYDTLRHESFDAWGFNAAEGTELRDLSGELRFANKRAAAWWLLRDALNPENGFEMALPNDDELLSDLTAPGWRNDRYGRILVEEKAEIRKRISRSTDKGDAVVMSIAIREDAYQEEFVEYDDRVVISAY